MNPHELGIEKELSAQDYLRTISMEQISNGVDTVLTNFSPEQKTKISSSIRQVLEQGTSLVSEDEYEVLKYILQESLNRANDTEGGRTISEFDGENATECAKMISSRTGKDTDEPWSDSNKIRAGFSVKANGPEDRILFVKNLSFPAIENKGKIRTNYVFLDTREVLAGLADSESPSQRVTMFVTGPVPTGGYNKKLDLNRVLAGRKSGCLADEPITEEEEAESLTLAA